MKMSRRLLGIGLTAPIALLACGRIEIPLAVTIREPAEGATLTVAQSFRVLADSDLDQPPSQPTHFEIQLWDPSSDFSTTWQVETASDGRGAILDESFVVPENAPPGEAYKLRVSVLPGQRQADGPPFAFGDTIRVRVLAAD